VGKLVQGASAQLLDLFPILQKLPPLLRPNFRYAQELHRKELSLYLGYWMNTKKGLQDGTGKVSPHACVNNQKPYSPLPKPCFCNDLLRVKEKGEMSDRQAGYLSDSLLEAGSDTTSSILIGFVQTMVVFPDVQEKAKEEIDRIVGPNRLPTMEDEPHMQYIRGCVKESIRWMPTAPLGVPHGVMQDDTYMGYKIPAGASIINNVWYVESYDTRTKILDSPLSSQGDSYGSGSES
jgi:hypothetical protein